MLRDTFFNRQRSARSYFESLIFPVLSPASIKSLVFRIFAIRCSALYELHCFLDISFRMMADRSWPVGSPQRLAHLHP
jgi:hypothetical protein